MNLLNSGIEGNGPNVCIGGRFSQESSNTRQANKPCTYGLPWSPQIVISSSPKRGGSQSWVTKGTSRPGSGMQRCQEVSSP